MEYSEEEDSSSEVDDEQTYEDEDDAAEEANNAENDETESRVECDTVTDDSEIIAAAVDGNDNEAADEGEFVSECSAF